MNKCENIPAAWVAMHKAKENSDVYLNNFWAYSMLDDVCESTPDLFIDIIDKILLIDSSEIIVSNLAAGPIEDFLVRHGRNYVDDILRRAQNDESWIDLIKGVWKNDIDDAVWVKLKSIRERA